MAQTTIDPTIGRSVLWLKDMGCWSGRAERFWSQDQGIRTSWSGCRIRRGKTLLTSISTVCSDHGITKMRLVIPYKGSKLPFIICKPRIELVLSGAWLVLRLRTTRATRATESCHAACVARTAPWLPSWEAKGPCARCDLWLPRVVGLLVAFVRGRDYNYLLRCSLRRNCYIDSRAPEGYTSSPEHHLHTVP